MFVVATRVVICGHASLLSHHKRRQLGKTESQTMLQVTGGIGDHEEGRSLAVGPPELLE